MFHPVFHVPSDNLTEVVNTKDCGVDCARHIEGGDLAVGIDKAVLVTVSV